MSSRHVAAGGTRQPCRAESSEAGAQRDARSDRPRFETKWRGGARAGILIRTRAAAHCCHPAPAAQQDLMCWAANTTI
eukprot:1138344-Pelagomonas_calceolata.AAC.3